MSQIIIYQTPDNQTQIDVKFEHETVWLTQEQMATLFGKGRSTITEHIGNVFKEGELTEEIACRNFRHTTPHGAIQGKMQVKSVKYYNLDVIISVGYRVKSQQGTQFRIWATQRLRDYLIKGFAIDNHRLKNLGGGNYWKELLDTIRDIRSSEKVMYRQVLDLYATAMDYNPKAAESVQFFKIVQNKLHFAAHGHTAAEVIYYRVDSDKPFEGLTNFKGSQPVAAEALIAKNYLRAEELKVLNNLVSAYFDLAEISAIEERPMTMRNYIEELDRILTSAGRKILIDDGKVSHAESEEKAKTEFRKYQNKTLSEVEKAYLDSLKQIERKVKTKGK